MNILALSDLHHEQYRDRGIDIPDIESAHGVDVIALLGDIDDAENAALWAVRQSEIHKTPVLLVPGNHEFYGSTIPGSLQIMREIMKGSQTKLLHDDYKVINDVLFIGATLWTDLQLDNSDLVGEKMSDYREIEVDDGLLTRELTTQDTHAMHLSSLDFIESMLEREYTDKVVVLSHHAPHPNSLSAYYHKKQLQAAYASDLSYLIEQYKIDTWLHGHVHEACDYRVGGTRIIAEPKGNLKEEFAPYSGKVITLNELSVRDTMAIDNHTVKNSGKPIYKGTGIL